MTFTELSTFTTPELIRRHQALEDRDDVDGPINQELADIETLLIERGAIDMLVAGI